MKPRYLFGPADNTTKLFDLPVSTANGIDLGASTSETDLSINQTNLTAVASLYETKKKMKMYTEGKLSKTPVAFNVVASVCDREGKSSIILITSFKVQRLS